MEDSTMAEDVKIENLNEEVVMTEEELSEVKGGIGLLLPAVQKVQKVHDASITDGTSNTLLGDGSVRPVGG